VLFQASDHRLHRRHKLPLPRKHHSLSSPVSCSWLIDQSSSTTNNSPAEKKEDSPATPAASQTSTAAIPTQGKKKLDSATLRDLLVKRTEEKEKERIQLRQQLNEINVSEEKEFPCNPSHPFLIYCCAVVYDRILLSLQRRRSSILQRPWKSSRKVLEIVDIKVLIRGNNLSKSTL